MTDTAAVVDALRAVADPCCRERGLSVVDMGLLRDVAVEGNAATVELLLTSGWCPFQVDLLSEVTAAVEAVDGIATADVRIVLDDVWSPDRLSERAHRALRFLPPPNAAQQRTQG